MWYLMTFEKVCLCIHTLKRVMFCDVQNSREVKHDVYGNQQTGKMKLLSSLLSCVYSRVKLFVFARNSGRRYSIFVGFIYGLEEKN